MQNGTESKEYQTEIIILKREVVEIGRAKRGKMNPTEGGGGGEREWGERVGKEKGWSGREDWKREESIQKGEASGKERGVEERREWKREGHRRERIVKKEGSGRKRESEERGDRKGRKE